MTDDDYVAELRSYGMLSTNQAADRIEALTAERDEARKKFDDTDLCWNGFAPCGWSLTLIDKADTAEAERDRYRVALERIAKCTQVSPSGEDRSSYEAQIALDALGPTIHAIEAPRADLKGETP